MQDGLKINLVYVFVMTFGEVIVVYGQITDKGSFILDNNYVFPVKPNELPYKWESMLCDGVWQQLHGFA